jgi:methionyl-tRNA formyltransferase
VTPPPWRIVVISTVPPVVERLLPVLQGLGHEPVAVLAARRPERPGGTPPELRPGQMIEVVPPGIDVLHPASTRHVAGLLRALEPDLGLCWGYPWKLPPEALQVPRLGCINQHPALLPRHRGPLPLAWALREGDAAFGLTWHRMDAELDTGAILAQTTVPIEDDDVTIEQIGPKIGRAALGLLPQVLARVAAGDAGDAQPAEGATWAGQFGEDYAEVDWSRSAREIHNQVRAWGLTFGLTPVRGPVATLEGERVRVLRTSLTAHPDAVARVDTGNGPLWILAHEPS